MPERKGYAMRFLRCICLTLVLLTAAHYNISPAQAAPPKVTADAAILMDAETGQIYFTKNHLKKRSPASLTKIMTAIIALEYGHLDDVVTVSKRAASVSVGSILDLRSGEKITLENLLKGALIYSANDTTVAIAEHVGGSQDTFLQMMNAKAAAIGALNTSYKNTNGYSAPNHYTTAYDLGRITMYALKNPKFAEFVRTRETVVEWCEEPKKEERRKKEIRNTNRLLRTDEYPGVDGVKTGTAIRAGNCLIASATRGERRLISVVLHSHNRYGDAKKMLDYGFDNIERIQLSGNKENISSLPITNGIKSSVNVVTAKALEVDMIKEDLENVQKKVELVKTLEAPVKAGQKVGEIKFLLHDQQIAQVDLVAAQQVPAQSWFYRTGKRLFG